MKILVVDGDEMAASMISSKLKNMGYEVLYEKTKNDAIARMGTEAFDVVFIDYAPLTSPRSLVVDIRRHAYGYPYIFITTPDYEVKQALQDGVNDVYTKPFEVDLLAQKLGNAERLTQLVNRFGDDREDFPSAGGVIAKSAFNQLFLSTIDRASRYGEHNFLLLISVANYEDLLKADGKYGASYAAASLSKHLVLTRRQSDIIGQTGQNEYALLLQRSLHKMEPVEAAQRFAQYLAEMEIEDIPGPVEFLVSLIHVPAGIEMYHKIVRVQR